MKDLETELGAKKPNAEAYFSYAEQFGADVNNAMFSNANWYNYLSAK